MIQHSNTFSVIDNVTTIGGFIIIVYYYYYILLVLLYEIFYKYYGQKLTTIFSDNVCGFNRMASEIWVYLRESLNYMIFLVTN